MGPPEKERPDGYQAARPDQKLAATTNSPKRSGSAGRNAIEEWRLTADQLTGHSSARNLHDRGLHVFPVDHPNHPQCIGKHGPDTPCDGQRGKHPAVKWGVWAHTVTPQMIDLEWDKYRGLANIGVACGPSQLVVLDEDAAGEIERWCVTYGITLPDTYTVTTGRGGHLYYRWDHSVTRIGNSEKAMKGFKINVRGDGGFAVGEGSRHADGHLYTGNGHEIAALPAKAATLLLAGATIANGKPHQDAGQDREQRDDRDHNNDKIGFHHRHNGLVAYAGRLRGKDLDYQEALPVFRARWLLCEQPEGLIPEAKFHSTPPPDCNYPVTWEEAEAKLRDVFGRYPGGQNLNDDTTTAGNDTEESPPKPGEGTWTDSGNAAKLVEASTGYGWYVPETAKWLRWARVSWHREPDDG